ncbi:MAG: hypothetical protein KDF60_05425 [Calditrichaeota bacterium]|nr:hypothetical protein [Calditrichota bacterium]
MIERDFIKRLIQQLAQVLAEIIFHKKNKDWQKAQMVIDVAGKQLLGLNPDLRDSLDGETLKEMFSYNNQIDHEKCLTLAMLFAEQANVYKNTKQSDTLFTSVLKKSIILFNSAFQNKEMLQKESRQSAVYVCDELSVFDLDADILLEMHILYTYVGALSKAEDTLYLLQQKGLKDINLIAENFYSGLLKKNDNELQKGNLPRDEILDGIKRFQNLS